MSSSSISKNASRTSSQRMGNDIRAPELRRSLDGFQAGALSPATVQSRQVGLAPGESLGLSGSVRSIPESSYQALCAVLRRVNSRRGDVETLLAMAQDADFIVRAAVPLLLIPVTPGLMNTKKVEPPWYDLIKKLVDDPHSFVRNNALLALSYTFEPNDDDTAIIEERAPVLVQSPQPYDRWVGLKLWSQACDQNNGATLRQMLQQETAPLVFMELVEATHLDPQSRPILEARRAVEKEDLLQAMIIQEIGPNPECETAPAVQALLSLDEDSPELERQIDASLGETMRLVTDIRQTLREHQLPFGVFDAETMAQQSDCSIM